MKKRTTYILVVTFLIVLFVLVYIFTFRSFKNRPLTQSTKETSTAAPSKEVISQPSTTKSAPSRTSSELSGPPYYATIKDERIQIFYQDKTTLFEDTGIPTDLLSPDDIAQLKSGIIFQSGEELYGYLEGLTS